jgi:hypothetical protein
VLTNLILPELSRRILDLQLKQQPFATARMGVEGDAFVFEVG